MFEIKQGKLAGCFELQPNVIKDNRGSFVKVFHEALFKAKDLETSFAEEYYSVSNKNVIRGLHFQIPPMDHVKMVYCLQGEVLDVVLDIRKGSPTYGEFDLIELSSEKANIIYIPKGMAHGFFVKSEQAVMVYKVSSIYSSEHDEGIHWNSAGIPWPSKNVITSVRDESLSDFSEFSSPFNYD